MGKEMERKMKTALDCKGKWVRNRVEPRRIIKKV
jgi:hypothetical protein